MIGAGVRDSCGNSESKGDPTGACAPRRTARGKRVPTFQSTSKFVQAKKNVDKLDFHRVCLHSEQSANADCFLITMKELYFMRVRSKISPSLLTSSPSITCH
ncbi:hypothetical protein RCO48_30125 [Peribacillus frigoritolerans]|nr:hypothetical protein [Peribacillus frigoritolerans]